jgi:hypothetical protein
MSPGTMTATTAKSSFRDFLEDVGKALALGTVLLPVTGVLVRLIAFLAARTVNYPLALAIAESPAQLIVLGFDSLFVSLLVLPLFALGAYLAPLEHRIRNLRPTFNAIQKQFLVAKSAEEKKRAEDELEAFEQELDQVEQAQKNTPLLFQLLSRLVGWPLTRIEIFLGRAGLRIGVWPLRAIVVVYWLAFFLFTPWPLSLSGLGLLLTQLVLPRIALKTGRVAFGQVWPLVVAILLSAAIGSGLDGRLDGTDVATYQFAKSAHMSDGPYARLGEASDRTILLACTPRGARGVIAVANADIETVTWEPWKSRQSAPTLLDVLLGHRRSLGFQNPC